MLTHTKFTLKICQPFSPLTGTCKFLLAFILPIVSANSELVNSDKSKSSRLELLIVWDPKATARSALAVCFLLQNIPFEGSERSLRVRQLNAVFFLSAQLRHGATGFAFKSGDLSMPFPRKEVSWTSRLLLPSVMMPKVFLPLCRDLRILTTTVALSDRCWQLGRLPLAVFWLPMRIVPYWFLVLLRRLQGLESVDWNRQDPAIFTLDEAALYHHKKGRQGRKIISHLKGSEAIAMGKSAKAKESLSKYFSLLF